MQMQKLLDAACAGPITTKGDLVRLQRLCFQDAYVASGGTSDR